MATAVANNEPFARRLIRSYEWWAILLRIVLFPLIGLLLIFIVQQALHYIRPASHYFEYQEVGSSGQIVNGFLMMTSTREIETQGRYRFNDDLECQYGRQWTGIAYRESSAAAKSTRGAALKLSWGWRVGDILPEGITCRSEHLIEFVVPPFGIRKTQIIDSEPFVIQPYVRTRQGAPNIP